MKDYSKSTGRWTKEEHLRFLQAIKIHDDDNGLNLPAKVDEHDDYVDK